MNERALRRKIAELSAQRAMVMTQLKIGPTRDNRIGFGIECNLNGKLYRSAQSWSLDYAEKVANQLLAFVEDGRLRMTQGGAEDARLAHNQEAAGSNPAPATAPPVPIDAAKCVSDPAPASPVQTDESVFLDLTAREQQ